MAVGNGKQPKSQKFLKIEIFGTLGQRLYVGASTS